MRSCPPQYPRSSTPIKTVMIKLDQRDINLDYEPTNVNERFPREKTSIEIWWSRLVDGKEPVCPFAGSFVMIVGGKKNPETSKIRRNFGNPKKTEILVFRISKK